MGVNIFGNGGAMLVQPVHDGLDPVSVVREVAIEAARLLGVINVGVSLHGGQPQRDAEADALRRYLVDAVPHRAKTGLRRVAEGVHLVR